MFQTLVISLIYVFINSLKILAGQKFIKPNKLSLRNVQLPKIFHISDKNGFNVSVGNLTYKMNFT